MHHASPTLRAHVLSVASCALCVAAGDDLAPGQARGGAGPGGGRQDVHHHSSGAAPTVHSCVCVTVRTFTFIHARCADGARFSRNWPCVRDAAGVQRADEQRRGGGGGGADAPLMREAPTDDGSSRRMRLLVLCHTKTSHNTPPRHAQRSQSSYTRIAPCSGARHLGHGRAWRSSLSAHSAQQQRWPHG